MPEPEITPTLLDMFIRRSLMTLIDRAGGQVTMLPEDLDEKHMALIFKSHDNPPRLVWTIVSDERIEELRKAETRAY